MSTGPNDRNRNERSPNRDSGKSETGEGRVGNNTRKDEPTATDERTGGMKDEI